ncbi:MAG: RNA-directed DNA polymerase, partial [Mesoflavibacter sp.]|nr:RNA-directed DNA polymerase [Mesoflavibacter sp.]
MPVKKKNGEIRIASDFRMLNARIKHSATPLPRIDDLYNAIGAIKPKYFVKLDMASGYHQIKMSKDAQEMSAVVCGPYNLEWVRMPFGISTSPGWFMSYMQRTLQGADDK